MASADNPPDDPANDQEPDQQVHQRVIKIDPDGDLILVVGKPKTRFLVCSKTLSRSAPFWKRCLYGQFKEAKPAADQDWVVEFPEDNPSAMKYVLLLVHGLGHKMPKVNLQLAFEVTVLTNKYDMTRALWAVVRSWLHELEPLLPDDSDDNTIVPQLKWLWVTKELGAIHGHLKTFAELSQIVSTTTEGDACLRLRPYEFGDASALTRESLEGYDAEKDVIFLLTDEIMRAREFAVSEIQKVLKGDIKTLRDAIRTFDSSKGCTGASICTGQNAVGVSLHSSRRRLCEYAMQAIVTKISAGKDSAVKPINKIGMSLENYRADAVCFTSRIQKEISLVSSEHHKDCTPFRSEVPSQGSLASRIEIAWWGRNFEAFDAQARVSGLEEGSDNEEDTADDEDQEASSPDSASRKRSRDEFEAEASIRSNQKLAKVISYRGTGRGQSF